MGMFKSGGYMPSGAGRNSRNRNTEIRDFRQNKADAELATQSAANDWVRGQSGLIAPQMQGQMPQGQQAPRFQPQFQQQGDFRSVGMSPMMQASQAYQNQPVNMESPLARIMRMYGGG